MLLGCASPDKFVGEDDDGANGLGPGGGRSGGGGGGFGETLADCVFPAFVAAEDDDTVPAGGFEPRGYGGGRGRLGSDGRLDAPGAIAGLAVLRDGGGDELPVDDGSIGLGGGGGGFGVVV